MSQTDLKETAKLAIRCLDLTTLLKDDTQDSVAEFLKKAQTPHGNVAAVCVYPEFVKQAADVLKDTDIGIATVINFPFGSKQTAGVTIKDDNDAELATPESTARDVSKAIAAGATEIDIVFDYETFQRGGVCMHEPHHLLRAAKDACDAGGATLKVIMETSAWQLESNHTQEPYEWLFDAAYTVAKEIQPAFLKTSTGKHPNGGAIPEAAEILISAAMMHNNESGQIVGVKISGGVKTTQDCAAYIEQMKGLSIIHGGQVTKVTRDNFRFGASSVLDDLLAIMTPVHIERLKMLHHPRPDAY